MGQAKFVLAAVSCSILIAQAATAALTIDDFEEGPFTFADYPATGVGGGEPTSREQRDLDPRHVTGGVRLVSVTALAKSVMTARSSRSLEPTMAWC